MHPVAMCEQLGLSPINLPQRRPHRQQGAAHDLGDLTFRVSRNTWRNQGWWDLGDLALPMFPPVPPLPLNPPL